MMAYLISSHLTSHEAVFLFEFRRGPAEPLKAAAGIYNAAKPLPEITTPRGDAARTGLLADSGVGRQQLAAFGGGNGQDCLVHDNMQLPGCSACRPFEIGAKGSLVSGLAFQSSTVAFDAFMDY